MNRSSRRRAFARVPGRWFRLAVLLAGVCVAPSSVPAFFSLPTGPSEKGDEVPSVSVPQKTYPGAVPASVRVLADREYQAVLEGEIAAARSEIMLVAYLFGATEARADRPGAVATRLAEAAGRGVKVEVILEIGRESTAVTRANRSAARLLARRGVKVFVDGSGTTVHARFVVIDRRLVFVGSHDLSESSLGQFRELSLLVESPALAASLLEQAAALKPAPYAEAPPRRPARRAVRTRPARKR